MIHMKCKALVSLYIRMSSATILNGDLISVDMSF